MGRAPKRPATGTAGPPSADWSPRPPPDPAWTAATPRDGEQRALARVSEKELSRIPLCLRYPGTEDWRPARLWDFSSQGFGVEVAGAPADLETGGELELRLTLAPGRHFTVRCALKNRGPGPSGERLGLRRLDLEPDRPARQERRGSERLALDPHICLRARLRHPFIFRQWSALVAADLDARMGMAFLSDDPMLLIFEGMEVEVFFELPGFRSLPLLGKVAWARAAGDGKVKFGVECLELDYRLHTGLCDFLLGVQLWTPRRLFRHGFLAQRVREHLRFRSVHTLEDYARVLDLRLRAYRQSGRVPDGARMEDMAARLDPRSRILAAYHRDRLVGSLTFAFPEGESTPLDMEEGFPGGKLPVPIPPKDRLIEVSRLCILPSYRGGDLLQGLFEHGLKFFLLSDREWLLTSAVDALLPVYLRIGFRRVGASYRHPRLNHLEHHVILAHKRDFLWGLRTNPLVWNTVFGDLVEHLLRRKAIPFTASQRWRIRAKLLLKPLAKRLWESSAERGFRRHLELLRQGKA